MKKIYRVSAFRVFDEFDSYKDAEKRFDELVNSGKYGYVEFSEVEKTESYEHGSSIKIFSK